MTLDEIFDALRDAVEELRAMNEGELRALAASREIPLPETSDTDELAFAIANWALGRGHRGESPCIVCGEPTGGRWFCDFHTEVKEGAYAAARRRGLGSFAEVMALRDGALARSVRRAES